MAHAKPAIQEESPSTFDVDTARQLEAGRSNSKVIGEELPCEVLKHLFKQPEWSALDGLNEYDEDYTSFTPRGAILTQDMIREYLRAENQIIDETERNVPRFSANGAVLGGSKGECEDDSGILSDELGARSDSSKSSRDQS